MISPRWRKVLRDLSSSKQRTLLVVLSIAVGVFAVGTVSGASHMIADELNRAYAATNPSNGRVYTTPVDDDFIDAVARMDSIRNVEGVFALGARVQLGPASQGDNPSADWRDITLETRRDFNDLSVNVFYPNSGQFPPEERMMVIERAAFDTLGVPLGEKVTLLMADGRMRDIKVVGTVHDLDKPAPIFGNRIYGYINFDTLEWLGYKRGYNQIAFVAAQNPKDEAHIRDLVADISDRVKATGGRVNGNRVRLVHSALDQVNAMILILSVIGSLSLFLASFLVVNTMLAILTQQVRQIGVMKTIGARNQQITAMYLMMTLAFGFLSLFVAVPLGALAAWGLALYAGGALNYDPRLLIQPDTIQLEILVGLFAPVLAALVPVLSGARVTVREAISTYGLSNEAAAKSKLVHLSARLSQLFPRPLILSLRNTFRRKVRLALTLFTLTLAGAMFMSVLHVQASLNQVVDIAFDYWKYDFGLNFAQMQSIERVIAETKTFPNVKNAEVWIGGNATRIRPDGVESKSYQLMAVPPDSPLIKPSVTAGRWLTPRDTNAIVLTATTLKDDPDIGVGDDITLKIDGRERIWHVVGVVRTVGDSGRFYVPQNFYAELIHAQGRGNSLAVVTDEGNADEQASSLAQMQEHFARLGMIAGGSFTMSVQKANALGQINILIFFMLLMAILLAVVGGLGLMGAMSINVVERQREIGVMRAIGASSGSLMQIFIVEAVIIGALSWVAGVVVAFPLGRFMSDGVGRAILQTTLVYTLAPRGIAIWLGLVLGIAALAALLPALRATQLSVREVLAYE